MKHFVVAVALAGAFGFAEPGIAQTGGPLVDNAGGASNVIPGTAVLQGTLTGGPADVSICWGTADGGSGGPWENTNALPNVGDGPFSCVVTNLLFGPTYFYRCFAASASGTGAAPEATSFTTLPPVAGFSYSNGLRGSVFQPTVDTETPVNLDGAKYTNSFTRVFTGDKPGTVLAMPDLPARAIIFAGSADRWDEFGGSPGDHFVAALSGRFIPADSGDYTFRWNQDDRGLMFIDMADDSVFDNSDRVGPYVWAGSGTKNLTAGHGYNFMFFMQEYSGGDNLSFWYTPPGGVEAFVNPTSQAGQWRYATGALPNRSIVNAPAAGLTSTSAVLNATLSCPGAVYDVYACWNTVNGGTNAALWTNALYVGTWTNATPADISCTVTGLPPDASCFFTFRATNSLDDVWATNVMHFGPMAVDNDGGALGLAPGAAQLRGVLYSTEPADVSIFWGAADGGTNGPWACTNVLTTMSDGLFSISVGNLAYHVKYYYRCYASNDQGTAWAPVTTNFTLLPPPPKLVVVLDEKTNGTQQAYASKVSNNDLLNAINTAQPTLSRITVANYQRFSERGPLDGAASIDAPDYVLNDGRHGGDTLFWNTLPGTAAQDSDGSFTVTCYLNTNNHTSAGYDLKTIDTFTAHSDSRAAQRYEVFVDLVGPGENWVSLGKFESASPGGSQQSHHMQLANSTAPGIAPFATGVAAIRFAIGTVPTSNGDIWREIDVQGRPTPSLPSGGTFTVK